MNALIAYTQTQQVLKLLEWTAELGGVKGHDLILYPFKGLDARQAAEIGKRAFKSVRVEHDSMGVTSNWADQSKGIKDASGPNSMMAGAAWFVYLNKLGPFFFWEPDAIPLVPDWLDKLEAEYKQAGKPFMGAYVPATATGVPAHLTGNAICPENTIELAPSMVLAKQLAFDVAGAAEILPRAHITKQIQHVFYYPEYPSVPTFPDEASLGLIRTDAVIFHRSKDGTLLQRLTERLRGRENHFVAINLDVVRQDFEDRYIVAPDAPSASTSPNPRVYTYFRAGHGEFVEEQKRLLLVWEREWRGAGFGPVILTEQDAASHPKYEQWKKRFEVIPTISPPGYEMACWLRWLAFAVHDSWLWTDYDVIPRWLKPSDIPAPEEDSDFPLLLCKGVPCAVTGTKELYENAIIAFLATSPIVEQGKPHLSDMHACQKLEFPHVELCAEYFTSGWKTAPLIHFPHSRCNPQARSQVIEAALKQLKAEQAGPVGPLHDTPEVETMASKRRKLVAELKLLSDTPSRKVLTYQELRKQGVIGHPKKRKKQRLVVM